MAFGNFYGNMGYAPGYFNPTGAIPDNLNQFKGQYQPMMQQPQQGSSGLLWVQGEPGAKSFMVAPGQSVLLMDSEAMRFYLKSADASGMPMPLRVFEYSEVNPAAQAQGAAQTAPDMGQYVTRAELDERLSQLVRTPEAIKEDMNNV